MDNLISIIVTVYNNETTLKDCIMSLIAQSYRNIEIIIVDDGSTDSSTTICNELLIANSRLTVIQNLHSGIASARNKGLEVCKGEYVTFVNASDTIANNMLETLKNMIDNYSSEIAVCNTKKVSSPSDKVIALSTEDALRQLLIGDLIDNNPYGKLFSRKLFNNNLFVEQSANVIYKIFENCAKVAFINNNLYNMNFSESFSFNSIINKDLRIMKSYPNLAIYCKCNIVKTIQDKFYNSFVHNVPVEDEDNVYLLFKQTLQDNDDKIASYFDYIRRAHLYILADDLKQYKMVCPVLPELE